MTKKTCFTLTLLLAAMPLAAQPGRCSLDRKVLAVYDRADTATEEEWAASRRAVSAFIGCPPESVDAESRRVFFEIVEREFTADHGPELERWRVKRPQSEALVEGILIYQYELRDFMRRLFVPSRDAEFTDAVLNFGSGEVIARLGPDAKKKVLAKLGTPNANYGLSNQYNSQIEAVTALGFWVDAGSTALLPNDKQEITAILSDLLNVSEAIRSSQHRRLVEATLKALSKSDDVRAARAIRDWMAKQPEKDKGGLLYKTAQSSATAIEQKAKKGRS
ncbi:MAG TPA: hypothetical protein VKB93_12600 [Thermoanaerobaculia bacterium]|nr:hypothetical protein [Thermoanaerobaculia bacterium]